MVADALRHHRSLSVDQAKYSRQLTPADSSINDTISVQTDGISHTRLVENIVVNIGNSWSRKDTTQKDYVISIKGLSRLKLIALSPTSRNFPLVSLLTIVTVKILVIATIPFVIRKNALWARNSALWAASLPLRLRPLLDGPSQNSVTSSPILGTFLGTTIRWRAAGFDRVWWIRLLPLLRGIGELDFEVVIHFCSVTRIKWFYLFPVSTFRVTLFFTCTLGSADIKSRISGDHGTFRSG